MELSVLSEEFQEGNKKINTAIPSVYSGWGCRISVEYLLFHQSILTDGSFVLADA
jgi:hypothetical protein